MLLSTETLSYLSNFNHAFHATFYFILTGLLGNELRQRNGITRGLMVLFFCLFLGSLWSYVNGNAIYSAATASQDILPIYYTLVQRVLWGWLTDIAIIYLIYIFFKEKSKWAKE